MASEYATGQSEEMEANPDDRWIEMFNARQKIFELEQIDRKFREERTAYLFLVVVIGGLVAISTALIVDRNLSHSLSNFAAAGVFIAIFSLYVALTQLLTVTWELRRSRELRAALKVAVYEATDDHPRGRSSKVG